MTYRHTPEPPQRLGRLAGVLLVIALGLGTTMISIILTGIAVITWQKAIS